MNKFLIIYFLFVLLAIVINIINTPDHWMEITFFGFILMFLIPSVGILLITLGLILLIKTIQKRKEKYVIR